MDDNAPEQPWYETVVIPVLLRHARTAYGKAMRSALAAAGCDDMPKNGMYVIAGLAIEDRGIPLLRLVQDLGISKQSAGQLVDTLVLRGYLDRADDPLDRRKVSITLTGRGRAAAATQASARERVDAELLERVGPGCIAELRRGLGALCDMGREAAGEAEPD